MARIGRVDVDINNRAIDAMFSGNVGEVVDFAADLARDVHTYSNVTYRKQGIGVRSGNLQLHTKKGGVLKVGPYQCRTSVYNDADYAAAVHDGVNSTRLDPVSRARSSEQRALNGPAPERWTLSIASRSSPR